MTFLPPRLNAAVAAGSANGRAETMSSTTESRTAISLATPSAPRLRLHPDRPAYTLLDGGWWPRPADPAAELPGLILALDERHGPVTRIMLGMADWNPSRPRRLRIDGPICSSFPRIPASRDAQAAMEQAAQAGNRSHTPALLTTITEGPGHP
jgi:Family of unknown function (DUF5994)